MIRVLLAFVLASVSTQPSPRERPLTVVKNERLAFVLARFDLVGETPNESSALRVRLLSVTDVGECSGTPESCPKATLYVVVSNLDLNPELRLYTVPDRYAWRLVSWEHFPKMELPDDYVVFVAEADEPSVGTAKDFWRPVRYRVKVDFHDGTIKPLGAG